jgi:hypothetical protein
MLRSARCRFVTPTAFPVGGHFLVFGFSVLRFPHRLSYAIAAGCTEVSHAQRLAPERALRRPSATMPESCHASFPCRGPAVPTWKGRSPSRDQSLSRQLVWHSCSIRTKLAQIATRQVSETDGVSTTVLSRWRISFSDSHSVKRAMFKDRFSGELW